MSTTMRTGDGVVSSFAEEQDETWDERDVRRSRRRRALTVHGLRLGLLVVVLVLWQLSSGTLIDPFWVSSPSEIAGRLVEWLGDGTALSNTAFTLRAVVLGYIAGSLAGIVVGFVFGNWATIAVVLDPFITAFYSLPKVALAPLFVLWFGIGLTSKVVLTAVIVFFLVFYNSYAGVRAVDRELVDVVRLMGAGRTEQIRRVVLPSAAAWIFTGLKLAVPYSLIGAVVGELTASSEGLGYLLKRAAGTFDTTGTFAALAILMVLAVVINRLVVLAEGRTSRWRQPSS